MGQPLLWLVTSSSTIATWRDVQGHSEALVMTSGSSGAQLAFTSSSPLENGLPPILAGMFSSDSLVRSAKELCLTCGTPSLPEV